MTSERRAIHTSLTAIMGWLALALHLSSNIFNTASFSFFSQVGTENEWIGCFAGAFVIGIVGLTTRYHWVHLVSIFLLATAHGSVGLCFYVSAIQNHIVFTAAGTYTIISALGYYLLWRRILHP